VDFAHSLPVQVRRPFVRSSFSLLVCQLGDLLIISFSRSFLPQGSGYVWAAVNYVVRQLHVNACRCVNEVVLLPYRLLQRLPKQMSSVVTRWSPIVFDHLTACAERVSERAAAVFELGLPAMQAARSEIAGTLVVAVKKVPSCLTPNRSFSFFLGFNPRSSRCHVRTCV